MRCLAKGKSQNNGTVSNDFKQLTINDMKNYQTDVCRYQPKPKAEVDNNKLKLVNSSYYTISSEFDYFRICFIVHLKE